MAGRVSGVRGSAEQPQPTLMLVAGRCAAAVLALALVSWSFGVQLLISIAGLPLLALFLWVLLKDTPPAYVNSGSTVGSEGKALSSADQAVQLSLLQASLLKKPVASPLLGAWSETAPLRAQLTQRQVVSLPLALKQQQDDWTPLVRSHSNLAPCTPGATWHGALTSPRPLQSEPSIDDSYMAGARSSRELMRGDSLYDRGARSSCEVVHGDSLYDRGARSSSEVVHGDSLLDRTTDSTEVDANAALRAHMSGGSSKTHNSSINSDSLDETSPIEYPEGPVGDPAQPDGWLLRQTSLANRDLQHLKNWVIAREELEICTRPDGLPLLLGLGAFGKVYKAMKDGTQPVAVKVIHDHGNKQQTEFEREINMLACLRDRNIVQFLGVCMDEEDTMLVTEFMENGDLMRMIRKDKERALGWYNKRSTDGHPLMGMGRRIALDIARGLHFLHSRRIVHFDLKSPNVLLGRNHTAKIADVGLAKIMKDGFISTAKNDIGTFIWMAPECLLGKRCTEKVDIFSYAVILWEICTGLVPQRGQMRSVRVPEECPAAIADLIERGMDADPDHRPTAKEIVTVLMMQDAALREKLTKTPSSKRRSPGKDREANRHLRRRASDELADDMAKAHTQFAHAVANASSAEAPCQEDFNLSNQSLLEVGRWYAIMNHQLEQCLSQPNSETEGSDAHRRMSELYEAANSHRAEVNRLAPRWFRHLEMVRLEDSGSGAEEHARPPPHHWALVAAALQLTEDQRAEVLASHRDVLFRLEQVKAQRQQLVATLQSGLNSDAGDLRYGAAAAYNDGKDAGDALNQCLEQERLIQEQLWTLMASTLSVVQMSRIRVSSHPWIPDMLAISNCIAS